MLFRHRLAILLHRPLWEIDEWPDYEIVRWLAYCRVEVLPDAHWDAALIAHTVAATMGGFKGKMDKFMPQPNSGKAISNKQLKAKMILGLNARPKDGEPIQAGTAHPDGHQVNRPQAEATRQQDSAENRATSCRQGP